MCVSYSYASIAKNLCSLYIHLRGGVYRSRAAMRALQREIGLLSIRTNYDRADDHNQMGLLAPRQI